MIQSALDIIIVLGCMLFGLVLMILGRALGLASIIGPWLVRGKRWCLAVLTGRVRINWPQAGILVTGGAGAMLIALGERWGFVIALVGQPLWIIETRRTKTWGMCAMAVYYTGVWALGAARAWGWWG